MRLLPSLFTKQKSANSPLALQSFMALPLAAMIIDENNLMVMVNAAFCKASGYREDELIGQSSFTFLTGHHTSEFYEKHQKVLTSNGYFEGEVWGEHKDGSKFLLLEKTTRIELDGETYYQTLIENVTKSTELFERYRYLAMHDALTGLANRSLAKDRFLHALHNSVREGEKLGILLCDLNEFKQVNDSYGHHIGDQLLIQTAQKLCSLVRDGDTVARIGGDEFLIVVERLKEENELQTLMQDIRNRLQTTVTIEGHILDINISIGEACSPRDGTTYENMLRLADRKMYLEKERYYGYTV